MHLQFISLTGQCLIRYSRHGKDNHLGVTSNLFETSTCLKQANLLFLSVACLRQVGLYRLSNFLSSAYIYYRKWQAHCNLARICAGERGGVVVDHLALNLATH